MKAAIGLACLAGLALGLVKAQETASSKPSTYTDGCYGFSLRAPEFAAAAEGTVVMPVMLAGPAQDRFSPNVNVVVQQHRMTRADYRTQTLEQFKVGGATLKSESDLSVSGKDAWLIEYEGKQQEREFRFLVLTVFDDTRTLLVTCTATKGSYAAHEAAFRACLDSFALTASQ